MAEVTTWLVARSLSSGLKIPPIRKSQRIKRIVLLDFIHRLVSQKN
jgi:hypothetical protein